MLIKQIILVAIGGGLGSVCRFLISVGLPKLTFPFATFLTNILGCFLIGLISAYFNSNSNLSPNFKLLLIMGFCGGFTTFSTFAFEKLNLIQNGHHTIFFIYVLSSITLGILAVYLGFWVGTAAK